MAVAKLKTDSESEQRRIYDIALGCTPDFIYVIGTDRRFLYANPALLAMWGRTAENAIGRTFQELGYEAWHAEMHERELDDVVSTRKPIKGEVPFTGTLGRRIYEYIFSPVFGPDGEVTEIAGTTRDVTERREAEEALRRSEEMIALALRDSQFVGTWHWDIKTNLVVADERFARLYSVDPAKAAKGAPIEEFTRTIHADDISRVGQSIERIMATGGDFVEEYRLVHADGRIHWVVARGRAHLDENGHPHYFAGAVIDITDRKEMEDRLVESQAQYVKLTDAVPQQIWTARPDGQLDFLNAYARLSIGDVPIIDGIVQWMNVVHPDDAATSIQIWSRCVATGEPYEAQQRILQKASGGYRWHLSRARPLRDEAGRIIKWLGTNTDIEDQKQTEQAVSEARAHLSLMVESAKDYAIMSLDKTGHIVSWNSGAERIFGYAADEIIGQAFPIIFTPEDRDNGAPGAELKTAARNGRATDERWHLRKNGERFYASGTLAAMHDSDGGGPVRGFVKIARDKTVELRAQEAVLQARNAAEAANIAKTEFLANMSHEIRTPMNAIIGLSNILAVSQPLSRKQQEFLKTLQMSADTLLALINDLLDVAKIEARTVELEHIPFNLTRIMQEVVSMMATHTKGKGLKFEAKGEGVADRMFMGDPTRLRQIIVNLCSNAIKFTEKGSVEVTITSTPTDKQGVEDICIAVRDTGIGIPQDKLATIFEKFVQADTSINRKYGGTGLGLAISKTLAGIMGGTLNVASEFGAGSTFTLNVPLAIALQEEVAKTDYSLSSIAAQSVPMRKARILLVEDYPANVLVATTFLEQFGYDVDVASNGLEAFQMFKQAVHSLILMDVQMHGMNGFESTKLIREHEQTHSLPHIPIIGMTAHALAGDRERCIACGMDDYLSKPFNPDELKDKIEKAIEL